MFKHVYIFGHTAKQLLPVDDNGASTCEYFCTSVCQLAAFIPSSTLQTYKTSELPTALTSLWNIG